MEACKDMIIEYNRLILLELNVSASINININSFKDMLLLLYTTTINIKKLPIQITKSTKKGFVQCHKNKVVVNIEIINLYKKIKSYS